MRAAVPLDHHAAYGHPGPAGAMPGWTAGALRWSPGATQDPPDRLTAEVDVLDLGQELGEVGVVEVGVGLPVEGDDCLCQLLGDGVGDRTAAVGVDESR